MTTSTSASKRLLVVIAFACVYFFWGSTFVAIRYGVQFLSPAFVSGFRYFLAGVLLMGILAARGLDVRVSRPELLRALLIALMMLTMNNVMVSWGEQYISAGYAALLAAGIPLLIAVAENLIPGGTPLNRVGWAGTVIGFAGLALLLAPVLRRGFTTHTAGDRAVLMGTVILLVANLGWVAGSL
jgi:drug/metabolite transporter (DMT)-like permease